MKRRKTSSRALLPFLLLVAAAWTTAVTAHDAHSHNAHQGLPRRDIIDAIDDSIDNSISGDSNDRTALRRIGSGRAPPVIVRSDPELCLRGCQIALREPTFEDVPANAGFQFKECYSPLMQTSLFLCLNNYCSDGRGGDGSLEKLNRTCTAIRNESLPSFEGTLAQYPPDKVLTLRRLQRAEAIGSTFLSEVVVLSEQLYENSYDTLADLKYVRLHHFNYGNAVLYFWLVVCLYGTGTHIYQSITQKLRHRRRNRLTPTVGDRIGRSTTGSGYALVDEEDDDNDEDLDIDDLDPAGDAAYDRKEYGQSESSLTRRPRIWTQRHLSTPATFGQRCSQDFGWYTVPPRVQSVTLLIFCILNIVACVQGYRVFTGNMYWPSITQQLLRYVSDRTGIVSWANFPLIWMFGMRNNLLLWMTGWDFGTYNNFHRWVARIATVQAIVHSIGYSALVWYDGGFVNFIRWWSRFFWWTGEVATILMSLLLVLSLFWMRRNVYEIFLIVHIVFSIFILFGMLAHVSIFHGEYDIYFWGCLIVWVADRAMRALRIVAFNPLFWKTRAQATYDPQSNIVRVVVPYNSSLYQPQPGTYYYLHVLNDKRFWESHPFTVATVTSLNKKLGLSADASAASSIGGAKRRRRSPPHAVELADQSDAQSESALSDTEDVGADVDVDTPTTAEHNMSENAGLLSGSNYGATRSHNPYQSPSRSNQHRPSSSHTAATSHSIASSVPPPAHAASAMTFLIRPYDSFTGRLRDKAAAAANPGYSSVDYSSGYAPAGPAPASLRVLVDGPYGHAQRFDDDYDSMLFVVGGSGIVVPLSHLTGIARDHTLSIATAAGRRLKNIRIIWAVREAAFAADVLREDLQSVFGADENGLTGGTRVTLDIYVTQSKPVVVGPADDDQAEDANGVRVSHERPSKDVDRPQLQNDIVFDEPLPRHLRVFYSRPDVRGEVEIAARRGRNRPGAADRKLAVVACGPGRMADTARKAVVDVLGKRGSGNVDYLEESFQW